MPFRFVEWFLPRWLKSPSLFLPRSVGPCSDAPWLPFHRHRWGHLWLEGLPSLPTQKLLLLSPPVHIPSLALQSLVQLSLHFLANQNFLSILEKPPPCRGGFFSFPVSSVNSFIDQSTYKGAERRGKGRPTSRMSPLLGPHHTKCCASSATG